MGETDYRITKLANIAMELLIKYKDITVYMAHEFSEQPEIDIRETMDMFADKRNEIYKLAGWVRHD